MRIGVKPGQWGWTWDELVESWKAGEECGFAVVSCFDHVSAAPAGLAAWDAPTLLAAMAGVVPRAGLAVDVLNSSLRHPFLLAGQLAVAQAASGGRLEVGLGLGSYHLARYDHAALGVPFPSRRERAARLEASCRALPALWRGEEVTDPALGLTSASLGPVGIEPPPIIVGGTSETVLEIASRHADGWNAVQPDPARYGDLARRLDELCEHGGRARPVAKAVQIFVRDIELRDARDLVARFEEAGAESTTFVLVEERGAEAVRRLAAAVL